MSSLRSLRALSRSRLAPVESARPHAFFLHRPLERFSRLSSPSSTPARGFHFQSRLNVSQRPTYTRFGKNGPSSGWDFLDRFDPTTLRIGAVVISGSVGYYIYHLERVPETGRLRFIDVSAESEKRAGEETFTQILRQYKNHILPPNHPLSQQVVNVAERILESTNLGHVKGYSSSTSFSPFSGVVDDTWMPSIDRSTSPASNQEWEVYVINDDTRNAFVLPGGKIFVFTGILPVCKNADGLASVLGHEIAHQVARHSGERMSASKVLFFLVTLLEFLGLDVGVSRVGLSLLMTPITKAKVLVFQTQEPRRRKVEFKDLGDQCAIKLRTRFSFPPLADTIGLKLMSRACFDPTEASRLWTRMDAEERSESRGWFSTLFKGASLSSVDILSTHPASKKRVKAMETQIPDALAIRAASSACAHMLGSEYDRFRVTALGN